MELLAFAAGALVALGLAGLLVVLAGLNDDPDNGIL